MKGKKDLPVSFEIHFCDPSRVGNNLTQALAV